MKRCKILFCILTLCMCLFPSQVKASETIPEIHSEYAIVINLNDDRIMYEKNIHDKMYPASMTKMMTVLVSIENIEDMNETYTFSEETLKGLEEENASIAGFQVGDVATYEDLLYGVMLPSGADASRALAYSLFGSEEKFVQAMNEKAIELNMTNTHFVNTSGLHDENHYSTVYDMALLLKYALNNDTFKTIFTTHKFVTSDGSKTFYSTFAKQKTLLDIDTSMILGSKTGFTYPASLCLASYASVKGESYIMVSGQTHSDGSYPYHIEDAAKLYSYFYKNYKRVSVIEEQEEIITLDVVGGKEKTYSVLNENSIDLLCKDKDSLSVKWVGKEEIESPEYKDVYLGKIEVYEEDTLIYTQDFHLSYNLDSKNSYSLGSSGLLLISLVCYGAYMWFILNKNSKFKR